MSDRSQGRKKVDVTLCTVLCVAFFQSFVLMTDNKDGGGGATAGGRNRQAAQHSVAVYLKLTGGTPGQNAAVKTGSELRLAEVVISFYFFVASNQSFDLIVLTFNSHCLTVPPLCIWCPLSIQLIEETFTFLCGSLITLC